MIDEKRLLEALYDLLNIDGVDTPQTIIDTLRCVLLTSTGYKQEQEEILIGLFCFGCATRRIMDDFNSE